jgi:hypothetical protein
MNDLESRPERTTEPEIIDAEEYARRLRVMLSSGSSGGWPRKRRDQWILLHAIAQGFTYDERLTEKQATARIQDFLLTQGKAMWLDAVTLRRALVDDGFLDRDDHGRDYRRSKRHERRVRVE